MFHIALAFLLFLLLALICANCADKASTKHTKSHNMLICNDTRQTVNLLDYAFDGSNPSPTTTSLRGKACLSPLFSIVGEESACLKLCALVLILAVGGFFQLDAQPAKTPCVILSVRSLPVGASKVSKCPVAINSSKFSDLKLRQVLASLCLPSSLLSLR
jgi:hypothetical protein